MLKKIKTIHLGHLNIEQDHGFRNFCLIQIGAEKFQRLLGTIKWNYIDGYSLIPEKLVMKEKIDLIVIDEEESQIRH